MDIKLIIEISIVAIIAIIFIGWLVWQIKKKGLKGFAIDMILKAEDLFEKGQNSEKMQFVIEEIRAILEETKLGRLLLIFITEESIEKFIQNVFDNLKKALDYTPNKIKEE